MKLDYRLAFINDQSRLAALSESLGSVPVLALDIETINWWHPPTERVALIQLAYRVKQELRVAVVDALAGLDPAALRQPLEFKDTTKVIHNAVFDAVRLSRHFHINTSPIHDTLVAARRNGEKRYSLKAQVEKHLHLPLDKSARQSDWSLRPLHPQQLDYAARDAVATLLLYEHQLNRGLTGGYRLHADAAGQQTSLPLDASPPPAVEKLTSTANSTAQRSPLNAELSDASLALLGIITELPSRYYPEQLAASIGEDRVGLAGWIIDRILGEDADLDESTVKLEIAGLCESGLVRITPTRRLEASETGIHTWHAHRPA
jgi:hypothetical protein